MKVVLIAQLVFSTLLLQAQVQTNKDLQAMVEAERAFSKLAIKESTRKAFLSYLGDDAIVFVQGPVNGKARWTNRETDDSKLDWSPEYADISLGGDLGYTVGPWEYRYHRTDKSAVAHGHFISVWQKGSNGVFWNILDIGVPHTFDPEVHPFRTSTIRKVPVKGMPSDAAALLIFEKDFAERVAVLGGKAHTEMLSREARLYRTNKRPFTHPSNVVPLVEQEDKSIRYIPIKSGMALSGDLGYVYGTAWWTAEGGKDTQNANYTRIWKLEDGEHWKIVMEVVSNWQ